MNCKYCGAELRERAKFCTKCGKSVSTAPGKKEASKIGEYYACKACGARLREGTKFCTKCGKPVSTVPGNIASSETIENRVCKACGAELREGAKFCTKCGVPIQHIIAGNDASAVALPKRSGEAKVKNEKLAWFFGGFLLGVLCTIVSFLFLREASSQPIAEPVQWESRDNRQEEDIEGSFSANEEVSVPETEVSLETEANSEIETSLGTASEGYMDLFLEADRDGFVEVTSELIKEYFPESTAFLFDEAHRLGNELDEYIKASYSFSDLIGRGMDGGISGEGSQQKTDANVCLLVFQWKEQKPYLIGYFVGNMEPAEDGRWCLKVTPCNYDLTPLYEQERESYEKAKEDWLSGEGIFGSYIPPEEVFESGAAYFIKGYNTGRSEDILEDEIQTYHIWYMYHSPYRREIAKKMERYEHYTGRVREGRYQAFLLLDENYEEIGYTVIHGGT